MLFLIKFTHSVIFLIETWAIGYILYSGAVGVRDGWLVLAVVLVLVETVVFLGNGARCPMTKLAVQMGADSGDDYIADIFLPKWFVPLVTPVCGTLAVAGILLVGFRWITGI